LVENEGISKTIYRTPDAPERGGEGEIQTEYSSD
jgi:hypothetical protein